MTEEKKNQTPGFDTEAAEDIITLIDEDDKNIDFRLMDVLELEGQRYAVLQPCDIKAAGGDLQEDEAVIFRLDKGENDEEIFAYIEDDQEWDFVVNTYNDMLFEDN